MSTRSRRVRLGLVFAAVLAAAFGFAAAGSAPSTYHDDKPVHASTYHDDIVSHPGR